MTDRAREKGDDVLGSVRDTVESIWIAIVLAFVLRAFVLEAFVIPTGSMAPRLMGQHWQFDCPACGYHYAYGLPHQQGEAPPPLGRPLGEDGRPVGRLPRPGRGRDLPAVCPNCRHENRFGSSWAFSGDRVLVLKYLYRFGEPRPWDVVVFKNPQDNQQNYIKRLIGLPGQMIMILHGDVFYSDGKDLHQDQGEPAIDEKDFDLNRDGRIDREDFDSNLWKDQMPWRILTKSPQTQEVMWQVVFDNDYQPDLEIFRKGGKEWRSPWQADQAGPWDLQAGGGRVFAFAGSPAPAAVRFASDPARFLPDYAYNLHDPARVPYDEKADINSDLKLAFTFVPGPRPTAIALHLSSFEHHFEAWVHTDGQCELKHATAPPGTPPEKIDWTGRQSDPWVRRGRVAALQPGRAREIALTHVDHAVTLWVDGQAVLTSEPDLYLADLEKIAAAVDKGVPVPTVAILASGGPAELWHVKLMQDVYYTSPSISREPHIAGRGTRNNPVVLRKFGSGQSDRDEFFVLGDNSPNSLDSRLWDHHADTLRPGYRDGTVPRYGMIGRAFFVYWPGGYRLPLLKMLPIVPNVGRMRLIR